MWGEIVLMGARESLGVYVCLSGLQDADRLGVGYVGVGWKYIGCGWVLLVGNGL